MKIFLPGLTLLFIGLKMTGTIDWSWFWVLSPYPIAIAALLTFFVGLYFINDEFRKEMKIKTAARKAMRDADKVIDKLKNGDLNA